MTAPTKRQQTSRKAGLENVHFRLEQPSDQEAIEAIHQIAFGPGRFARTAFRLRGDAACDEALSFVALLAGALVATIRLTPIQIGGQDALLLGPLAVLPDVAHKGIGRALVKRAVNAAESRQKTAILLVGDLAYYGPLGFKPVPPGHIQMPGPVDPRRLLLAPLNGSSVTDFRGRADALPSRP